MTYQASHFLKIHAIPVFLGKPLGYICNCRIVFNKIHFTNNAFIVFIIEANDFPTKSTVSCKQGYLIFKIFPSAPLWVGRYTIGFSIKDTDQSRIFSRNSHA